MKVLVLGGSRYFGKRLVHQLVAEDYDVTVANRGLTPDDFSDSVKRFKLDRTDSVALNQLAQSEHWDIVYDQICYSSNEASVACKAFEGRVGRYVHTSTGSVYTTDGLRNEEAFDPYTHSIKMGDRNDFNYGEGKRQAEAVFFQQASFPVVAMRIPIVLGLDDYTGRLEFHIAHIRNEKPLVVPNLQSQTSFISSEETANFLFWLGHCHATGPINGCSNGFISIAEIVRLIEVRVGKKAIVTATGADKDTTSFVDETSRTNDNSLATDLGFQFKSLKSWLPKLIDEHIG